MRILIYLLLIFAFYSCATLNKALKDDLQTIDLLQDDKAWRLTAGEHTVQLEKGEFRFVFLQKPYGENNGEFHAVQVNASQNLELFNSISLGKRLDELECFSPGTGMAMTNGNNPEIMVVDYGHHYLYYKDESDKRLTKLGEKAGYYYLEWKIDSIMDEEELKKEKNGYITLYMSVIIDRNKNARIDKGELWKVAISLAE